MPAPLAAPPPPVAASRTAVFRCRVRDLLIAAPPLMAVDATVAEVARRMTAERSSAVLVLDKGGGLAGIVTEQDVVRRGHDRSRPAGEIMSAPVLTVGAEEPLYRAIGFMRRHRLKHMPVLDPRGALAGMLELHEALAVAAGDVAGDIDRLTREDSLQGLAEVKAAQIGLAGRLLAGAVPVPEIQALLADLDNDLHRRVLDLLLAELGPPPVPFACIVMGSGGRGESLLFPDQDNGFVLADYPDARHPEIDRWFVALAERFAAALDGLGFPLCRGGVMAMNPVWRKTLPQWRAQLAQWMRGRVPETLLNCEIFFDFRRVWGERELTDSLRSHAIGAAQADRGFQMLMYGLQALNRAGIGLFGRLRVESSGAAHRGEIDLKQHGALPLVEAVRLLALARGIAATGTLDRIAALREADALRVDDADWLRATFTLLTRLLLRRQLADHRAGRPLTSFVDPERLTARERDLLRDGLRAINDFRAGLRAELTGSLL